MLSLLYEGKVYGGNGKKSVLRIENAGCLWYNIG